MGEAAAKLKKNGSLVYDLKNRPGPIVKEHDLALKLPHEVAGGYNERQLLNCWSKVPDLSLIHISEPTRPY